MSENTTASTSEYLLRAWLNLTSILWNTRLVSTLTFNEAHVMGLLLQLSTEDQPMTATALIAHTRLLKSQMNKILTSLEARGYLTRTRSEQDKRQIHIRLTKEGEAIYRSEHDSIIDILTQLVDQIGEERADFLASELRDVTGRFDAIISKNK